MDANEELKRVIRELAGHPVLAHRMLFGHRHPQETPAFHHRMIVDQHSAEPRILHMAFRGSGKSTIGEEALVAGAALQEFSSALIIGESEQRAAEHLRTVKHEIETNERLRNLFRVHPSEPWTETKALLSNGVMIQAYGRGQSLRGVKHLNQRPDFILIDDLEDEESVKTPSGRDKTLSWLLGTLVGAMDPAGRIRMLATPLDPDAAAVRISADANWRTRRYPIRHVDADGALVSMWPERFPLAWVDETERVMRSLGKHDVFVREYMLDAVDPESKAFRHETFRREAMVRSPHHAVYAMVDPARTVKARSADTGYAVWSWAGNRLVVWEGIARKHMPSEIIAEIFRIHEQYDPVVIGVEKNGLDEFLMEPLRHEQVRRRIAVPVRPMSAPKGKLDFIKGLQPFFLAGEVAFAGPTEDLEAQLLSFPTGNIDAPNALAYALRMRPGAPMYEDFGPHALGIPALDRKTTVWLAVNARGGWTTAVLAQIRRGALLVFGDWAVEGLPGDVLHDIWTEVALICRTPVQVVAPAKHWTEYNSTGLRSAVVRLPAELTRGGDPPVGRDVLRAWCRTLGHGASSLTVNPEARWTAKAMGGGYCRAIQPNGIAAEDPEDGVYAVLMEGLEAFLALTRLSSHASDDSEGHYAYTKAGVRYLTSRVR